MTAVKASQKGFQNFRIAGILHLSRKIRRISAVLTGTDKKYLDAYNVILAGNRHHVARLDVGIFDIVSGLYISQRANTVTINQCRFIILLCAGLLHFCGKLGLNLRIPPLQKINRLVHQPAIILFGYPPHTRSRTTFDLIHQTRPLTVFKHAVTA